ncbi:hypothetical protein HYG81_04250 [Natrinema zhouii]|uniref:Uncharacterized protein n=1 Tax=Natrinema zhouii TaxID=1710539 RepID=A0A7D6CRD3_9EURY|nr:hypothetical protein [Natrinema zhouii]QLK26829.1 hypothetical protein HYG81_04250 [Natrinema zhouii]
MEAIAHTLGYYDTIIGDTMSDNPLSTDQWTDATVPLLVMGGGRSPLFF